LPTHLWRWPAPSGVPGTPSGSRRFAPICSWPDQTGRRSRRPTIRSSPPCSPTARRRKLARRADAGRLWRITCTHPAPRPSLSLPRLWSPSRPRCSPHAVRVTRAGPSGRGGCGSGWPPCSASTSSPPRSTAAARSCPARLVGSLRRRKDLERATHGASAGRAGVTGAAVSGSSEPPPRSAAASRARPGELCRCRGSRRRGIAHGCRVRGRGGAPRSGRACQPEQRRLDR
jgi:hypothetical protein